MHQVINVELQHSRKLSALILFNSDNMIPVSPTWISEQKDIITQCGELSATPIKMHFSYGIFMSFLDLFLSVYERYVEGKLLVQYWECCHTAWFWLTITCILLPAVIGAVTSTVLQMKERDCGTFIMVTSGFVVFPISNILW